MEIVENPAGAPGAAPRWDVAPEPVVDIGTLEGEPEYELARVQDATVLSDGRVVVAHEDPAELRFYGPDGTYRRTVGGEGEGPGEFARIGTLLRLPGDTLMVHDRNLNRVSRFSPDGAFLGSVGLRDARGSKLEGRFRDGTLVVEPSPTFRRKGLPDAGMHRDDRALVTVGPDGSVQDTLLVRPGVAYHVSRSGRGFWVIVNPFSTAPEEEVASDALYTAHGRAWEYRVRGPDDEVRRIVRLDRPRRPLREATIDSLIDARTANIEDPGARRDRVRRYREISYPELRPAFDLICAIPGCTGE